MDEEAEYSVLSKAAYDFFHGGEALTQLSPDAASVRRLCVAPSGTLWLPGGGALGPGVDQ